MEIIKIIEEIKLNPKRLVYLQEENKLIKIINKGLILGKNPEDLATDIVNEFSNIATVSDIVSLINTIKAAIDSNSGNSLSKEDLMHAEKIAINILNKDPKFKTSELLKDIKVALATNSHNEEIEGIIKSIRIKYLVDFESLGIDTRFKPKRKDFYIVEEKKGAFIALAPNNSKPTGYVIGFGGNKIFFLGYKDGVVKEEYTRNYYTVRLIYGLLPGGKVVRKLNNRVICKGVPLEEIPDSLAEQIRKKFLKGQEEVILGLGLSGGNVRKINGKVELETIPYPELLDDLQSRIAIVGSPGSGKTVVTNIIQRQIIDNKNYLKGGTVTIAKDVPHLTNVGNKFKSFGDSVPNWNEDNSAEEFLSRLKMEKLNTHKRIVISSDSLIPDLNKLSKETIIALIENSNCSEQVKNALKKCIEEATDVVKVLKEAREGTLLGSEYLGSQDSALRRLMNSIIPANYATINKIDLRKTLKLNKDVAFFIKGLNGDAFATMIMWELYALQKAKEIVNPIVQGRLLVIDECQKFVRDDAFKDIFQRTVLDGRNFGICMVTIFQNEKEAEKYISYPDFVTYQTYLEEGKRMINIKEKVALIPPIAPEAAS